MSLDSRQLVEQFLKCSETDIFERFNDWAKGNVKVFGTNDFASMLIPGTRDDRTLLVAHVDTVWNDSHEIKPGYNSGLLFSENRERGVNKKTGKPYHGGIGIGADDRAGIALLWALKDLGHSILLTGCEEMGCVGSMQIMSNPEDAALIHQHNFAVQFDRHGRDDLVFYNVGTPKFEKYVQRQTDFTWSSGTFTDICILCEQIAGVNMSVGYKNEHTPHEILNLRWWERTYNSSHKWLSQGNLPKFSR